ncbi:MAG: molecular chaperone TorD family protein [Rhodospirillales bacterium]
MQSESPSETDHNGGPGHDPAPLNEADRARAGFYVLLSRLLAEPPSEELLVQVRALEGDESLVGTALARLAKLAKMTDEQSAYDEFSLLFYGKGEGGEVLPYASYYLTGMLNDKPLADLRGDMAELGIARGDLNKEPEDHIAFVFEMMHGLIVGSFGAGPVDVNRQTEFFNKHIAPWAMGFFEDLEDAKSATFFAGVAGLGRVFLEIEQDAFRIAA